MTDIPKATREEIAKYKDQDLDTLFSIVDLIRSSKESVLYLPGNEVERGQAHFDMWVPLLRHRICKDWNYCAKRNDPDLQDDVTLIAGVADAIASVVIGFPPVLISTILVKKGLTAFCGCRESEMKTAKKGEGIGEQ
jgi:hypothetical protein